ncbi:hypothetical protein P3T36_004952 [Kitasatospora sp. MAP12-15]|uniref:hypothetical protein n=1 Tax=unclassified Kitasatospora TaxID=2633591 RepID=UPI0024747BC9|nr:hypothetical protein [Kitasatospora sp. MAP12-44]MDH6112071.1 hypothetical protein [Kitasatospora sp. MAP12-44]
MSDHNPNELPLSEQTAGDANPGDPNPVAPGQELTADELLANELPADELPANEPAPRRRPQRASLLRWGAAVLLFVVGGTATAFAVTAPARTDLPGLATPNDGRYAFAPLTLPPLPPGRLSPSDDTVGNRHYADLRQLVLAAPKGAITPTTAPTPAAPTPAAPSKAPVSPAPPSPSPSASAQQPTALWAACADYAKLDANPPRVQVIVTENACRAAATRVWTAPDGTRTELWLQSFGSFDEAHQYYTEITENGVPNAVPLPLLAPEDGTLTGLSDDYPRASGTIAPGGKLPIGRYAYLVAGDVVATVVMSNPAGVLDQPFQQVVTLQSDLLN